MREGPSLAIVAGAKFRLGQNVLSAAKTPVRTT
jgi:hypothetical protein